MELSSDDTAGVMAGVVVGILLTGGGVLGLFSSSVESSSICLYVLLQFIIYFSSLSCGRLIVIAATMRVFQSFKGRRATTALF